MELFFVNIYGINGTLYEECFSCDASCICDTQTD